MSKKKVIIVGSILLVAVIVALSTSYAMFRFNVTKNTNFKLALGTLELTIKDTTTEDKFILKNTVPTKDDVALGEDGYKFTLTNTGTIDSYYSVYLDDILLSDAGERLDNSYIRFNLLNESNNQSNTSSLSSYSSDNRLITNGFLKKGESVTYILRTWVKYEAGNEAQNKYFATQIRVVGTQANAVGYQEEILNGSYPVLKDNLVPVVISDTGVVTKADINKEWYSYEKKNWANSVILKDESVVYKNGEEIPEDNIESYFVWIPKYSYQLFDLGNYSGLTSISDKTQEIKIKFGTSNTSDNVTGECTTPMKDNQGIAGTSGNCKVGDYMTHPAFLAFDTTGLWVGKFETGYDGATSTAAAQVNSVDTSKIIIKPNVYSWRNITVGNMFKNSYDYKRDLDSHMMKNTEWGSVAYLQHSIYGSQASVRINNNSAFITGYAGTNEPMLGYNGTSIDGNRHESTSLSQDGTYTVNYLNQKSVVASTTDNYSGIYDMSGGAWEYSIGYTIKSTSSGDLSGITSLYSDFFSDNSYLQYWDRYTSTIYTNYNNRIFGDATGEMGPFGSEEDADGSTRNKSSWYKNYTRFTNSSNPWFAHGGNWDGGTGSGILAFSDTSGGAYANSSYRIVLAPTK
jgi:hypothetical protein